MKPFAKPHPVICVGSAWSSPYKGVYNNTQSPAYGGESTVLPDSLLKVKTSREGSNRVGRVTRDTIGSSHGFHMTIRLAYNTNI